MQMPECCPFFVVPLTLVIKGSIASNSMDFLESVSSIFQCCVSIFWYYYRWVVYELFITRTKLVKLEPVICTFMILIFANFPFIWKKKSNYIWRTQQLESDQKKLHKCFAKLFQYKPKDDKFNKISKLQTLIPFQNSA